MHPAKINLSLEPNGRHIDFSKEMPEVAHLFRRVGSEAAPWQRLAVNTRSPYLDTDTDTFAPGTQLEYYLQHETQHGVKEARSHVVSTTLP